MLDEYGGFSGIITMEDVAEQLLGEIYDEHEISEGENIQEIEGKTKTFLIQGETPFLQFCDELDINFEKAEKIGTIAAYIMNITGDIPKQDDIVKDEFGEYKITKMNDRRIEEITFTQNEND